MRQAVIVTSLVTLLTIVLSGGSRAQSLSSAEIERRIIEARKIGYDEGYKSGYQHGRLVGGGGGEKVVWA